VNLPTDGPRNAQGCQKDYNAGSAMTNRVNGEICATNQLKADFKNNQMAHSDLKWNFMGMQETGMYRNWPLIYQCRTEAQCSGCSDPRFRSWYASAASGPKDVILILDRSGSMKTAGRMQKMQTAAQWVVNTLSENDYAQVVSYSGSATAMGDKLINMNTKNRKLMKEHIGDLQAYGGTNMGEGVQKAFKIAEDSWGKSHTGEKLTSGCANSRIILFLTDGVRSDGTPDPEVQIRNLNKELGLRVFTYTLGSGAGESKAVMKRIACENHGVWQNIADSEDNLKEIMASYFVYLSAGISQAPARWSDWFEDGQGLGQIAGACQAVFDRTKEAEVGVAVLFGVICKSIHRDTWEKHSDSSSTWAKITTSNAVCPKLSLSNTQLEYIRGKISPKAKCAYTGTLDEMFSTFNAGTSTSASALSLGLALLASAGLAAGMVSVQ